MTAVFLGTPEFAVPSLQRMLSGGHRVVEVVTQPDRPKGRRQELARSPVKELAERHGISVYQPERIRRPEAIEHLRALTPDVMVVVGYGQIIPQPIIDIPKHGIINVHASLLPDLRGAAPIQWSVARGHHTTGVTTMRIDAGLDTGDISDQWSTSIGPDETAPELSARLAEAGADLLLKTLAELEAGTARFTPQDNARATLAPIIRKEDGRIDWTNPAPQIHNLIRGFQPWPGAHTSFRGQSLHLWRARLSGQRFNREPGTLLEANGIFATGGDGSCLELLEVQLEGRRKMPAAVFCPRVAPHRRRSLRTIERNQKMRPFDLPLGFKYATAYAGIRKQEKDDLALIVSGVPAAAAAVFTTNKVQAAPVKLARANMRASKGICGAILINSGNANCATRSGDKVAANSVKALAKLLKLQPNQVLPASTGVIGVELEEDLILSKLQALVDGLNDTGLPEVARAILTTDLQPKGASREVALRRGAVRIAGVTKGSGMIHPRMATTLGFVMTDAVIPQTLLRRMLMRAAELSYNRISVDGDTSTNDTLVVMANGASGVRPDPKEMSMFEEALTETLQSLARQIVRDGEGARKLISVEVHGAATDAAAAAISRSIANSPLVKTAIAGSDPNWGRILAAAGNSGINFDPSQVEVTLQDIKVCRNGLAAPFDELDMKQRLDDTDVSIVFRIAGKAKGTATFWTCDLTEDYIHINASYRS